MKYIIIALFCFIHYSGSAQQNVKQLQETAKTLLQQGQFDKAVAMLETAVQQEPGNIDVLKDLSFACYLKRDFAKAIEIGKRLIEKPEADEQVFQILGMSYKSIAAYKECAKLYKDALVKFPNSGVIYNEYGELLAMDADMSGAIIQWEKGIAASPGYSSDYYNAATYYSRVGNWVRALLYGEIFLNIESYTQRTGDIKKLLLASYKNLVTKQGMQQASAKAISPFEKAVLETLNKAISLSKETAGIENIGNIRTRFISEWFQGKQQQYPYRLFDQQQYLVKEGMFEAYNQWLFGAAIDENEWKSWQNNHAKEKAAYTLFQQSRVFSMPQGQYYMNN